MEARLKEKITEYYTKYYRDDCCLPNWQHSVELKYSGIELEKGRLDSWTRDYGFTMQGKKHLIVGAGTGELSVALKRYYGADIYGLEPDPEAVEIIHLQCKENDIDPNRFVVGMGESIAFSDEEFDFVHCFMVLEHVTDTEKVIDEMLRVVKPTGRIIIHTPNYAFPEERHYKIVFPTFLPKFFGYLYLTMRGKDYRFYKTINRVTERSINRILVRKEGVKWYRVYQSSKRRKGAFNTLLNYLLFHRFVYPQQVIILFKDVGK